MNNDLQIIFLIGVAMLITSSITYNLGYQEAKKDCKPLIITDIPIFPKVNNYKQINRDE